MFDSGWERGPDVAFSRAWSTETPDAGLVADLLSTPVVDPAEDDGFDAVERLGAWEAVAAWAQACQVQTAADLLASRQARASRSGSVSVTSSRPRRWSSRPWPGSRR